MTLQERAYMHRDPEEEGFETGTARQKLRLGRVFAVLGLALLGGCIAVACFTMFGPLAIFPFAGGIWLGLRRANA